MKLQIIIANERKRFETWATEQGWECDRIEEQYVQHIVGYLWEAWQAATRLNAKERNHVVPERKLRLLVEAYDDWSGTLDPADRPGYLRQMNSIRELVG